MNALWLTLFGVAMAAGQILFKRAANVVAGRPATDMMIGLLTAPSLWAALVVYGAATVLWIWILTRVPLSRAYPFAALGMILVPLASALVYGERVGPMFWGGILLVVAGIILTQQGVY